MGQYIQIGICTALSVERTELDRFKLSIDEMAESISAQSIDLSLFEKQEGTAAVRWTLPAVLLERGLVSFLRSQYPLATGSLRPEQTVLLDQLDAAGSWDRMQRVIESAGSWMLQRAGFTRRFRVGAGRQDVPVELPVLVYLVEGKAMLECYDKLFRYMERTIAVQRASHPLAAVVKVFLGKRSAVGPVTLSAHAACTCDEATSIFRCTSVDMASGGDLDACFDQGCGHD